MFSFWFFIVAGAIPFYFVLSSKVNDGLIIKLGFIFMSIGFFGAAGAINDDCDLINPCIMSAGGVFIVMLGVALRIYSAKFKIITDWVILTKRQKTPERRASHQP